jgi:hypothetical protein
LLPKLKDYYLKNIDEDMLELFDYTCLGVPLSLYERYYYSNWGESPWYFTSMTLKPKDIKLTFDNDLSIPNE